MATRGQSPEVRQARARAREIARGREHLSPRITGAHRAAVSRIQLERAFGDLPFSRELPNIRVRDRDDYNGKAVAHRLGKTDSASQQKVFDTEYYEELEYEGEDDDDPFWYH